MANTPGKGLLAKLSISASFTTIGQVVEVELNESNNPTIDVTVITDTSRKFIQSIIDAGEVMLTMNFDPADTTHIKLKTDHDAGTEGSWQLTMTDPGAAVMTFAALCTKYKLGKSAVDNVVQLMVTLKITGAVTITP